MKKLLIITLAFGLVAMPALQAQDTWGDTAKKTVETAVYGGSALVVSELAGESIVAFLNLNFEGYALNTGTAAVAIASTVSILSKDKAINWLGVSAASTLGLLGFAGLIGSYDSSFTSFTGENPILLLPAAALAYKFGKGLLNQIWNEDTNK